MLHLVSRISFRLILFISLVTHADSSRDGMGFSGVYVFVCLSVSFQFSQDI